MKDNKPKVVKACMITVGVVLVLSTAFIFLAFRTDYIFNIDTTSTVASASFDRTSVTTVIEEIDELEGGSALPGGDGDYTDNPLIPSVPGVPDETPDGITGNPDGWYEDIPVGTAAGNKNGRLGNYDLYNGLPWDADSNTYIYYAYKAKDDIYAIFEQAGITRKSSSSLVIDSAVAGFSQGTVLDGVKCLGIGSIPAALDRNYYPSKCFQTGAAEGDSSAKIGTIKMATVLVPKGADRSNTSAYIYLPSTKIDAKAHTFYGGVVQTNVKVMGPNQVQVALDWSGVDSTYQYNMSVDPNNLLQSLKDVNDVLGQRGKYAGMNIGAWGNNDIETYNLGSAAKELSNKYDVVGFVVWHDSF